MRLARRQLLPFEFTRQAETFGQYLDELKKLMAEEQEEVKERRLQLEEGVFAATDDPRNPGVAPAPPDDEDPPHLNFAPLENAINELARAAADYDQALEKLEARLNGAGPAGPSHGERNDDRNRAGAGT